MGFDINSHGSDLFAESNSISLKRFSSKGPYVPSFTQACFKITQPHQMTPIIETQYGYHIAWVTEVLAPKDTPSEEIEKEVRRRLLPEIQGFEFKRLFGRLQKLYPVHWFTSQP